MIQLKVEHDYIVGDTEEWLADISAPHDEAQAAFDEYCERDDAEYYVGNNIRPWLESLGADGLYGDSIVTAASVNEDNWLDRDVMVTLAHTAEYGDLLIYQYGYYLDAPVYVAAFNGGDDADAYSWAGGSAGHADGSECDSEWIIESACKLWPNGGRGETHDLWDLEQDADGNMLCPDHNVPLGFVGY